jgi:hypothetical protein
VIEAALCRDGKADRMQMCAANAEHRKRCALAFRQSGHDFGHLSLGGAIQTFESGAHRHLVGMVFGQTGGDFENCVFHR